MCCGFVLEEKYQNNYKKIDTFKLINDEPVLTELDDISGTISDLCLELEGLHKCSHVSIDKVVKTFSIACNIDLDHLKNNFSRKKHFRDRGIMCTHKEIDLNNSKAYIVRLYDLLSVILKNNSMREWFTSDLRPESPDGILRDVIHGSRFQKHPAFKKGLKNSIFMGLYVDDVEFVNPLGKNRGVHKLCMMYVTFYNIPVEMRSKLSSIFVIGVANAASLKEHENLHLFVQDLAADLNILQDGVVVNGEKFYLHLYTLHGDALGLHQILGLKQSFSPWVKKTVIYVRKTNATIKILSSMTCVK